MISFLKKLGAGLAKFAAKEIPVITGIATIIQPFLGSGNTAQVVSAVVNDLTAMGTQVIAIETALQGKAGTEKLSAVIPLIGNIVKTSELVAGKKIGNEALFTTAIQEYAQATVDLLNSLDAGNVG